ncbi:tetratricopeptide repeat protein [Virgibacillus oceani]|uniref:Tetratricopeptide repeat protein n=1 Tax=Virgibacillus oceani TaxID=1479511 RepID=A0A917HQ57_9BACI|nr:tetratricopeptide repeat protein [Virgibacillus oceani]GGG85919.1 hypothetical protein GCM10011398_34600 [Virgibacillus oceani]
MLLYGRNTIAERMAELPVSQINPKLIKLLIEDKTKEIPDSPTKSCLTGKYVNTIIKNNEKVDRFHQENSFMLTCKSCGRKGKYDVGHMVVNTDGNDSVQSIQTTGYFRCKHCNDAGNWEMPNDFMILPLATVLKQIGSDGQNDNRCSVGKFELFDGSWHLYSSDAENHLLTKINENPLDGYLWNRLGNLYHQGNRPELAVNAFEQSVAIDPNQTESHYTLGNLLSQMEDFENAAYHYKRMLLTASDYRAVTTETLRQILAVGLQGLYIISQISGGDIPFLPTRDELIEAGKLKEFESNVVDMEIEIVPNQTESFYPSAEIYMGARQKELPASIRTLKKPKYKKKTKKRHKRTKRK